MGNFHCIPSTCARVVWREYLPPVVRWRYPGEEWKEIEADDYQIDDQKPQFDYLERKSYKISAKAIVAERVPLNNDFPAVFNKGQIITVFVNKVRVNNVIEDNTLITDVSVDSESDFSEVPLTFAPFVTFDIFPISDNQYEFKVQVNGNNDSDILTLDNNDINVIAHHQLIHNRDVGQIAGMPEYDTN